MNPRVFITPGGKIVLDQTAIRVSPQPGSDKQVVVHLFLPADKEYTFPDNAVQIRPVPTKDQRPLADKPVSCKKGSVQTPPVPELRVTAVELAPGLKSSAPQELTCSGVADSKGKQHQCSFLSDGTAVYKYSIDACQGDKLLVYDPFNHELSAAAAKAVRAVSKASLLTSARPSLIAASKSAVPKACRVSSASSSAAQ